MDFFTDKQFLNVGPFLTQSLLHYRAILFFLYLNPYKYVNNFNNMLRLSMITTMTTVQSVPNNMKIAKIPPRDAHLPINTFFFASLVALRLIHVS